MNKHKGFFNWVFKSTELNSNNITAVEQMERKVQEGLFDGVFKDT